ncbi:SurA N-terminal domain-containing protein [Alkaliflexus imshenetskii]|uniref:SurA N-terminal domain-containing protein n=1 Tax=Alkaliflexus imshenetskii TaxID=286730 RepID=UPI00047ABBF5|nr:SurA N-terminal domain-containing protein [Alkaliflexus imshenetskii]
MATLEKIRSKGGVIVAIFIGFALFAFIMMDFMGSGGSFFSGSRMELANINGTTINIQEFQNKVTEMEEFNKLNQGVNTLTEEEVYMLRDHTWNQLVNQTLLEEIYDQLGLRVTSEELMDMLTGRNIHPAIRQHPLFTNPQTGMFDQQQVLNFLFAKNQDPTAYFYWMVMEEQLINERLFSKYKNLLMKGMYIPTMWKESELASRSKMVDFDFVVARYTTVDDSEVAVSDAEIRNYYRANQNLFKQEASREIEYITFDIVPTEADRQAALEWVEKMMENFANPEIDAAQFVNLNSDEPFMGRNRRAAEFSSAIEAFITSASVNAVYGPYFEDDSYKAVRLVAINNMPDSVRARHILIREPNPEAANKLADSLMTVARRGGNFAELARTYSEDPGSAINGGDLGWFREGMMVAPFNDAVFNGKAGDIVKVETQFGIHIIHIQEQGRPSPKYQVATLARNISYSSKTYQDVYSAATRFAALNNTAAKFNTAIEENNLTKRFGRNIRENDRNVGPLESSRELVRWAYEANVGALSPVFEFGDRFVIAHLISSSKDGVLPLDAVRARIERELINEKKADLLISRVKEYATGGASMEAIAEKLNSSVQSANDITFASFQVPGAGVEPALVSLAVHSPTNQISQPVKGNNGVYLVKVTNVDQNTVVADNVSRELVQNLVMKVEYQLMETLRENAVIVDRRAQFY